jgi:hypothetical protein
MVGQVVRDVVDVIGREDASVYTSNVVDLPRLLLSILSSTPFERAFFLGRTLSCLRQLAGFVDGMVTEGERAFFDAIQANLDASFVY